MSARSESKRHDWDRLSLLSKTKDDKATRQANHSLRGIAWGVSQVHPCQNASTVSSYCFKVWSPYFAAQREAAAGIKKALEESR